MLDKLMSNEEPLTSILKNWKRNRILKKYFNIIEGMDDQEITIYKTFLSNESNLFTDGENTKIEIADVHQNASREPEETTTISPKSKIPIVIGNLEPPKLSSGKDLLTWNNELTNFFAINQIPKEMQLNIATTALDNDTRAKITMFQKYCNLMVRDRNELISHIFKQSNGMEIGASFRGMTHNKQESAPGFLPRLDNLYSAAFPNSTKDIKNRDISEQFIAGINNERMARKLLSSPNKSIGNLLNIVQETEKLEISIKDIRNRGMLIDDYSINSNQISNNARSKFSERARTQKFSIKSCKFCKNNRCKIQDRACSYCHKGNCRKHIYMRTNAHLATGSQGNSQNSWKKDRNKYANNVEITEHDEESCKTSDNVNIIESKEKNNLLFVEIELDNIRTIALIDSGSTVSIVRSCLVSNNSKINSSNVMKLSSFNGNETHSKGTINLNTIIDNRSLQHKFLVVDDMKYEVIIGYDFLKKHQLTISATDGLLFWNDEWSDMSMDVNCVQYAEDKSDVEQIKNETLKEK
ncbi:hypothetical protein SNEBB_007321, partial [Seison nebaliae]